MPLSQSEGGALLIDAFPRAMVHTDNEPAGQSTNSVFNGWDCGYRPVDYCWIRFDTLLMELWEGN